MRILAILLVLLSGGVLQAQEPRTVNLRFDETVRVDDYCMYWSETSGSQVRGQLPRDCTPVTEPGFCVDGSCTMAVTHLDVTDLDAYYYKVTARNAAGESAFSNEARADFTIPPTPPNLTTIDVTISLSGTDIKLEGVSVAINAAP